jgi:hypothetical protein
MTLVLGTRVVAFETKVTSVLTAKVTDLYLAISTVIVSLRSLYELRQF